MKHRDTRILSLRELVDLLHEDEHNDKVVFLELKLRSLRQDIVATIKKTLIDNIQSRSVTQRIVICMPTFKHLRGFMRTFRGHKILLICRNIEAAKKVMRDDDLGLVHFLFRRQVLMS
ncbi:hypothetical protein BJX99DRAFT_227176 [Aspergillus californicus]